METSLRELQLCILDIALEFKRICEKYDLQYFMAGGTLLGAVRHHGYIPWDDDMDFGMPRKDYEIFLQKCEKELQTDYFLQTYKTDESFGHGFAKIRINGTSFLEDYATESSQHNGIFLDIFPFDNLPSNKMLRKTQYILFKGIKWAALGKSDYRFKELKKKRFALLMKCLFFGISKESCMRLLTRISTIGNKKECTEAICMYGAYGQKDRIDKRNIMNTVELPFEGYTFKAPSDYEGYLKSIYGDYMKLPPEDKRGGWHSVVHIDRGNYSIKNKADRNVN